MLAAERCVTFINLHLLVQLGPVRLSEYLIDVSPLSSLTSLNALYLGCGDNPELKSQLVNVSPLSSLVASETFGEM